MSLNKHSWKYESAKKAQLWRENSKSIYKKKENFVIVTMNISPQHFRENNFSLLNPLKRLFARDFEALSFCLYSWVPSEWTLVLLHWRRIGAAILGIYYNNTFTFLPKISSLAFTTMINIPFILHAFSSVPIFISMDIFILAVQQKSKDNKGEIEERGSKRKLMNYDVQRNKKSFWCYLFH